MRLAPTIFAIAISVCVLGYGTGLISRATISPSYPSYQPARHSMPAAKSSGKLSTVGYEPNCNHPSGREDADLCAQWAAVEAVQEGNQLTRLNIWITGAEFLALLASLIFTGWAAMAAARAANASDASVALSTLISDRQLRAYVALESPTMEFDQIDKEPSRYTIFIPARNFGQTPAIDFQYNFAVKLFSYPIEESEYKFEKAAKSARISLAPNQSRRRWAHIQGTDLAAIKQNNKVLMIQAEILYKVPTGNTFKIEADYMRLIVDNRALQLKLPRALKKSDFAGGKVLRKPKI